MYWKHMKANRIIQNVIPIILLGLFITWYHTEHLYFSDNPSSLRLMIFYTYHDLDMLSIKYIHPLLFWLLPLFFLLYLVGDYLDRHLSISAIYTFTRTSNRGHWIFKRILTLFLNVTLYYFILFSTSIIYGILGGKVIRAKEDLVFIGLAFALKVVVSFLIVLAINGGSIFFPITSVYVSILLFHVFSLILTGFFGEYSREALGIVKYFPATLDVMNWYDSMTIANDLPIDGMNIIFVSLYLVISIGIITALILRKIKRMDIL